MHENTESGDAVQVPAFIHSDQEPSPLVVLLSLIGFVFAGAVLGSLLVLAVLYAGGFSTSLLEGGLGADASAAERWVMRTALGLNHLATFLGPGLAVLLLFYNKKRYGGLWMTPARYLSSAVWPGWLRVAQAAILMLVSAPLVLWLYNVNQQIPLPELLKSMENQTGELLKGLLQMDNPAELLMNLLIIAFLPALGEELIFRGILQKQFQRMFSNPWMAILSAACIFSIIHMQFEGFLSRWLLGILLGWLYWRTNNFWVPVVAHFFNNGIQVIAQYFYSQNLSTVDLEKDIDMPWYAAVVSCVLVFLVVKWIMDTGEPMRRLDSI